ncbi:MAG: hypothetical protein ACM31C_10995, partial [Acidobacteriota bacterium]
PRRAALVDVLRAYADRGVFPHLDAPGPRTPRFIDPQGRLCAVGFLIASTDGEAVAKELGARYEYALVADIDDPRLDAWAAANGFTRQELAMIQPEYGFEPPPEVRHRVTLGGDVGGGYAYAGGRALSYVLWGADVHVAVTGWLALAVEGIGPRVGDEPDGSNHLALSASPVVELSRHAGWSWASSDSRVHLDLGLTAQQVLGGHGAAHPTAALAGVGLKVHPGSTASGDFVLGAEIALADGFVADERIPAGGVAPFLKFAFAFGL